ncbi:GNAT family N-acetyltransferase [Rhizobium sullae]|uniref:N-acetyltransferase n=1 Tax=Rhizobium sullae TaxID=50338 RepID=A0A2N0D782_RHISU|nr:GNAT family N-acetyltransferase [Rhizobium sullae]PKA41973.1 N-acetyltransferase [Rhizobium sullae]UWU14142.1 GNAT family N-acetyltransferase [Rhizobium sullae]
MRIVRIDESFSRWNELLQLILSSFAYMNGRINPPSSALSLTLQSLAEKATNEIGYVALEDEDLLGCMFLRPEPECLYLGKLAVAPKAQGKSVGRKLLQLAEAIAKARSLPTLRLDTRIELTDNHTVFAAWGFEKTAEKSHPGFDRVTYIEMRKVLAT